MKIAPASSSWRTTPTIRPWASSTTRLRCGGWILHLLAQHLAPRSDMLERIRSLTSSLAPRSASARSFWSTSLSTSWIERSSSLRMSSKTNSSARTSSASSVVSARRGVEYVPLGGAVGVVEDLGERPTPPAAEYSCWTTLSSFCRMTLRDLLDHVRARLAHPRDAQRDVGLLAPAGCASPARRASVVAGSRSRARSSAATRCAGTSTIWSGGVRRRNSNGVASITAREPAEDLAGALGADRAREHVARVADAALGEVAARVRCSTTSWSTARRARVDRAELGHLDRQLLDHLLAQVLEDLRGALGAERRRASPPCGAGAVREVRGCSQRRRSSAMPPPRLRCRPPRLLLSSIRRPGRRRVGVALGDLLDLRACGVDSAATGGVGGSAARAAASSSATRTAPRSRAATSAPAEASLLAALQRAPHEEEEDEGGEAEQHVLALPSDRRLATAGGGRRRRRFAKRSARPRSCRRAPALSPARLATDFWSDGDRGRRDDRVDAAARRRAC